MKVPSLHTALQQVAERLAELVGVNECRIDLEPSCGADATIVADRFTFVVEWKRSGLTAQVAAAIDPLKGCAEVMDGPLPLVAVPFMGEAGAAQCAEADVAWLDLSGNARIFAPGLRILVEGKPNLFKRRGRPSSAFAPKSSRIARWLLMRPCQYWTQREVATATDMDEGYTSKVVARLERDGLIRRDESGAIKPRDPDLLLDAWREVYDFSKHHIIRGHVAARSGDALLRQLAETLLNRSTEFAATGLGAAWLFDHFAGFRTTTLYLAEEPSRELLSSLLFRAEERGANVWLVIPNDQGVFHGAQEVEGIPCVHPVQVYLDLGAHPERGGEASSRLRATQLTWRADG